MESLRRRGIILLSILFLGSALVYLVEWYLVSRFEQATDNAYVGGDMVQITPQRAGVIVASHASEYEFVDKGNVVIELEGSDSALALEQAKSFLALQAREVAQLYQHYQELLASVELRRVELEKAKEDLKRREGLYKQKAVAEEELIHTRRSYEVAQAQLQVSKQELAAAAAVVENVAIREHPSIAQAGVQLKQAYLNHQRRQLRAPVSGYVVKRMAFLGQEISPGQSLLSVIPLEHLWVDANFKEDQLQDLRLGQPVELTSDWYGKNLIFHGKVVGISAGAGGVFSLLPPQNATGNWIKVVQRVPVRIQLDPQELKIHPLRVGLSMQIKVNTKDKTGPVLKFEPPLMSQLTTEVLTESLSPIETEIQAILEKELPSSL